MGKLYLVFVAEVSDLLLLSSSYLILLSSSCSTFCPSMKHRPSTNSCQTICSLVHDCLNFAGCSWLVAFCSRLFMIGWILQVVHNCLNFSWRAIITQHWFTVIAECVSQPVCLCSWLSFIKNVTVILFGRSWDPHQCYWAHALLQDSSLWKRFNVDI